jgi:hypothetical protein
MTEQDLERTTPLGLGRYAYEYMDAALVVDEARGPQGMLSRAAYTPAYFLAFHSIELSLKAYLLNAGLSLDELSSKKYGHRLQKLYDKAMQIGLRSDFLQDERDEQALHLLIDLNEGHQLRYLVTGFKRFPLFSIVGPFGVRLHQSISRTVGCRTFSQCYQDYEY